MLAATDFFSVEVWTPRGLRTYYVLFFIELSTRRVEIAGITQHPDARFMALMARNITDCEDGFLRDKRYLIHDRDGKYSDEFLEQGRYFCSESCLRASLDDGARKVYRVKRKIP